MEEIEQHVREYNLHRLRRYRNHLLDIADKKIFILEDDSQDTSAWRVYRKALRDITDPFKDAQGNATSAIDTLNLDVFPWPSTP